MADNLFDSLLREVDKDMGLTDTPPTAPAPEADGMSVGDRIKDIGNGIVGGVGAAVEETSQTVEWAAGQAVSALTGGKDFYRTTGDDGWEWLTVEEAKARDDLHPFHRKRLFGDGGHVDLPNADQPVTMAGGLARGVSQFMTGYALLGRQIKVGGAVTSAMAGGAVTDFVAFDEHEDRFSDFLRDTAGLEDPVTAFLQADPNDTVAEGKLKNALEGIGLGVAAEGLIRLAKSFRTAKGVQLKEGDGAAAKVMNDEVAKIVEEEPELFTQMDLFDTASDVNTAPDGVQGPKANPDAVAPDAPAEAAGEVTAHNKAAANARTAEAETRNSGPVNIDKFNAALDEEIALQRGGSFVNPDRTVEGDLFNFDTMDVDVDIKDVMNMAASSIREHGIKDSETLAAVAAKSREYLANAVDVDGHVIDGALARMAADAEDQQAIVVGGKMLVQSLSRRVEDLAFKISAGRASDVDYNLMVQLQARLVETSANLKSVITGAAQTTSAGRIRTHDILTDQELSAMEIAKQLTDNIEGAGGHEAVRKLSEAIIANKNAKGGARGLMRVAEGTRGFWSVINEYFINSLLSGPKTHMINAISNVSQTVLLPAEHIMGSALRADVEGMREGARQYAGIALAVKDAAKYAAIALKTGRNHLDPEAAILEANGVDFRAIRSNSHNPMVRGIINGLGDFIRLPSRLLMTSDEFFKQINYRSHFYSRAVSEGLDLVASGQITRQELGAWVARKMDTATTQSGAARSQVDLDYAREATFTDELTAGSVARWVQRGTNNHPWMKLLAPFVRTPTNVIVAAGQRSPLFWMSKRMMDDLRGADPSRAARARGKLVTGGVIWTSALIAAQSGTITGSGPSDPAVRKRLMETGWRPYSFVMSDGNGGKKYIDYRRLDPFAMVFGIAADIADVGGQLDEMKLSEIASAAMVGLANNLASKAYLSGAIDAMTAFNDPDRYGASWFYNYASSMVPHSSLLRELRKSGDPAMREVRSMLDAVMNTVPGFSDKLPAKRSWITGEPIVYPKGWGQNMMSPLGEAFAAANPILEGEWKKDLVLDELARLDFGFSAPTRTVLGVELNPEQYSRYNEIHGTVRLGRYTMYQALEALFTTQRYDLARERAGDSSDPALNPRIKAVQRVISRYRKAAKQQLFNEYPELQSEVMSMQEEAQTNMNALMQGVVDMGQ